MSKLRVLTLTPLVAIVVLSACTATTTGSDSDAIDLESAALSDISVEEAAAAIVKAQEITDAVDATVEAMAVVPTETATPAPKGNVGSPTDVVVRNIPSGNVLTTLDSEGFGGRDTSITIGADGLGLISYFDIFSWDNRTGGLKVAHCDNTFCSP